MASRFLNNITVNDSYTMPSADGTADQIITTDGAGQLSFVDQSTISSGSSEKVVIYAKNTYTASIAKGTPVYITGTVGATDTVTIAPADAGNSAMMPAVGILDATLAVNDFGYVITGGFMDNITTDPIDGVTPSSNQTVYVKSGGGLTLTKPTGSQLIQNIAKVGKVSGGNAGSLIVSSILRTNDVPNLTTGKIWVGTATNTAESGVVHLDESNGRMGIGTPSPSTKLDVSGVITATGGNSTEWNTAYDNSIVSAAVTGTTTKTLTLTQQDAGTVTASWSDETGSNNYVTGASFSTITGILTLTRSGLSDVTTSLDGRYLTGNQTITLSGDVTGSGTTSISTNIAANVVGAAELDVSGNGTAGQVLTSDGDGTFSWTTPTTGDITGVTAGTGLSGGGSSGTVTLDLDLGELTIGGTLIATDYLIAENGGVDNRQLISSIPLSIFNNDSGWTSNVGDITGVTAGTGLSGGGTSGTVTLTNSDPGSAQYIFKNIAVSGQTTVVADSNNDTLTLTAGTNVSITTDATTDTITINSIDQYTGTVTSVGVSAGIGLSGGGTITTSGTISLALDLGELTIGGTLVGTDYLIAENGGVDNRQLISSIPLSIFNNDSGWTSNSGTVTSVAATAGSGISISGSPITTSGTLTITNSDPGSAQNIFKNIAVSGQSTVVADSNNDTLTLVAGTGITLTTDAVNDSITITNSSSGLTGSGTTNYIPKWSSSSALTDSPIVDSSGNIGINISSPSQRLHIGTSSNSGSTTEEFRIQTGRSGGFGGNAVINLDTGNFGTSGIYMGDNGAFSYANQPCKIEWLDSSTIMQFTSSNAYAWRVGTSTQMYMTSAGNVGINTTTPAEKLEVAGNVKADKYINQRVAWNSTFTHTSGTGVWQYIPVGYIIEQTTDTYYLNWIAAYGGRVRKVVLRGAGTGNAQTATTTQFRVDVNGSTVYTTGTLTVTGTSPNKVVTYEFGDNDAIFSATDRVQVLFNSNGLWYNAAVGIIIEYTE